MIGPFAANLDDADVGWQAVGAQLPLQFGRVEQLADDDFHRAVRLLGDGPGSELHGGRAGTVAGEDGQHGRCDRRGGRHRHRQDCSPPPCPSK